MAKTRSVRLAVRRQSQFETDPSRTLVVVVAMENEFCHPGGKYFLGPEGVAAVRTAAATLAELRAAGARVMWVRSVRDTDAIEFRKYGVPQHLLRGTWAVNFTAPLHPLAGEPVLEKTSHDCFVQTSIERQLQQMGVEPESWTIVVMGVALHVCVHHAVLGFHARGFQVAILLDCVAPRTTDEALAALSVYGSLPYSYNIATTDSSLLRLVVRPA